MLHLRVFCMQTKTLPFASSQVKRGHTVLSFTSIAEEYKLCLKPISSVFLIRPEMRNIWNLWNCHQCFRKSEEKCQLTCSACPQNILFPIFIYLYKFNTLFLSWWMLWLKKNKKVFWNEDTYCPHLSLYKHHRRYNSFWWTHTLVYAVYTFQATLLQRNIGQNPKS